MEDNVDLELGLDTQPNPANVVVRKNISLKLKNSGSKTRGSTSTSAAASSVDSKPFATHLKENIPGVNDIVHKNHKLKWDHKVNIIGEKVLDPLIHSCERCLLPILVYGRLLPCKHVFCHSCAVKSDKMCPRCSSAVNRVERSELGSVFVCTYGGSRHGTSGCHRTYLSKRDLQAHIQYRHLNQRPPHLQTHPSSVSGGHAMVASSAPVSSNPHHVVNSSHHVVLQQRGMMSQHNLMHPPPPQTNLPPPPIEYLPPQHYVTGASVYLNNPPMQQQQQPMLMQQHGQLINMQQQQQMSQLVLQQPPPQQQQQQAQPQNIMVMASRSANLITVPLQDEQLQQQQQQQLQQQQQMQQQQMQQQPPQQHYMLQQHMQPAQQKPHQYMIAHNQNHVINRPPIVNQQSNVPMIASYQPPNSSWSSNQNVPNAMTSQRSQSNQMHPYY